MARLPWFKVTLTIPDDGVGTPGHQQAGDLHMAISHGVVQRGVILKPRNVHQSPVV